MSKSGSNSWEDLAGPATREPRTLDTRGKSTRRTWSAPQILPDPIPQDGWSFKWVRAGSRGVEDNINVQKRLREGWELVQAEEHPEIVTELGMRSNTGNIEIGGLLLCKMPTEMVEQRRAHYSSQTNAAMDSADNYYLRNSDERMQKVLDRKRQTVFGQ